MDTEINPFQASPPIHKKRILFVITQSEFGGAQQFLFQFLKHVSKDIYEIHVATGSDGEGTFLKSLYSLNIPSLVISSLRRDINPVSDILAIREIRKLIDSFNPETLFLLSSKAGFIGSLAAQFSHSHPKVIYRIGGWSFNDPWPKWKKFLWKKLEQVSSSWKDVIVVNNTHDLNQAGKIGIKPRQKIALIHNGLDPYKIDLLPKEEACSQLGLPIDKKIIGTVANFYPSKGLEYFVEAADKTRREDTIWCIIGDGSGRLALEKLIKEKGLTERVFLLGRREPAAQYLNAFDLFVLTSIKEGSPWSLLEAMVAKLPVIATRVGAVPEIIEDGISGYIVEPANSSQIAEKVGSLLENSSRAQEMGIQAHQRVLFAFSINVMITRIEELL
jgi:glycosyltransferase involved in cell wall biosynthesis